MDHSSLQPPVWPANADLKAAMVRYNAITDADDPREVALALASQERIVLVPVFPPDPNDPEEITFASLYQLSAISVLHVFTAPEMVKELPEDALLAFYPFLDLFDDCRANGLGALIIDPGHDHAVGMFVKGPPHRLFSPKRVQRTMVREHR